MNDVYEEIRAKIRENKLIIFVGAGVPATINLPTWSQLIDEMSRQLEFDTQVFKAQGDYLCLAEYYLLEKGDLCGLQEWMQKEWTPPDEVIIQSEVYNTITSMGCKVIYTTNYDQTLETAFSLKGKKWRRIVNVADMMNIPDNATQIIKFHGDMADIDSMVVSESNYFERLNFENPLDIRLRSDMLGKSILFIGYSLNDINIRLLLYKLNQLWKHANVSEDMPKSYIFLARPDLIQEWIFNNRGIIPIVGAELDRGNSLRDFLANIAK